MNRIIGVIALVLLIVLGACSETSTYNKGTEEEQERVERIALRVLVNGEEIPAQVGDKQLYAVGSQCVEVKDAAVCDDVAIDFERLAVLGVQPGDVIAIEDDTYEERAVTLTVDEVVDSETFTVERLQEVPTHEFVVGDRIGDYIVAIQAQYEGEQLLRGDVGVVLRLSVRASEAHR